MGADRMWNTSGILVEECFYQDHEPYKHHRRWHSNGQLFEEKVFHGSPKLFDFSKWTREGQLLHKGTYHPKNNNYLTQLFAPNGTEIFSEWAKWNGSKFDILEDQNA